MDINIYKFLLFMGKRTNNLREEQTDSGIENGYFSGICGTMWPKSHF